MNTYMPCVTTFKIDDKSDFIILGCKFKFSYINHNFIFFNIGDGIYDRLENEKILNKIWTFKKKGKVIEDIHQICGKITDAIIKFSMEKNSVDNVSVIFIAFKNFENKMKDINFEYEPKTQIKCQMSQEDYDLNDNI